MGQLSQFAPFLLMFVVIYFFMIRPQQKRAKAEKEFESSLKVGDKIITKSGLHGKIAELAETTVVVGTFYCTCRKYFPQIKNGAFSYFNGNECCFE